MVRVNKAGCLDACAYGPTMVIYPDDVWYSPKTKEDIEEIITNHIQNNRTVSRLLIEFNKNHKFSNNTINNKRSLLEIKL